MPRLFREKVIDVQHWTDGLFSFRTTRDAAFRFESGQFTLIGLEVDGRPLLRPFSMASAYYEDHLEFLSIKVPDGALTSRLQHVEIGDEILVGAKTTGTLLADDLKPGRNLFLLGTGTGLAPFMSLIRDPDLYMRFERIVLVHGCRRADDLAYRSWIESEFPRDHHLGGYVQEQLLYYPTVTREPFQNEGRITSLLRSGGLVSDLGLPALDPALDRVMICGSPAMTADTAAILDELGFVESRGGRLADYALERAFVDDESRDAA